jgi:hypothetical protein
MLADLTSIIDTGFKFVPCWHYTTYDMFSNLLNNIDNLCCNLNNKFTFSKIRSNSKKSYNEITSSVELDGCKNTQCFFDQFKQRKNQTLNKNLFKMNSEIMIFRYKLINKISQQRLQVTHNLSNKQLSQLKNFKRLHKFEVVELDKNIGVAFMSKTNYIKFANEILTDSNTYKKLDNNPFDVVLNKINVSLTQLKSKKDISKQLYNNLRPKNTKIGTFRLLPKLHKDKFACRPIVNCKNHPTSTLTLFLDIILREYVQNIPSYIKDSQDLMNKCANVQLPNNCHIYSCDFESLYTNIDSKKCLLLILEFLNKNNHKSNHYNLNAIKIILELILYNNIFKFNDEFYVQIRGISMGIICGPTLANLYLSILEEHFLTIEKPIIFYRYIDDIFMISLNIYEDSFFNKYFGDLKLNIIRDKMVNFLDLYIKYDDITNSLEFSLFVKPTHTNSYLSTNTNHPKHIIKNIPKAQFLRVKRICTSYIDYIHFSRQLIFQFYAKGYNFRKISHLANVVGGLNRKSLLKYKEKSNNNLGENCAFVINKYDESVKDINSLVYSTWNEMNNEITDFKFQLISTIYQNIKNILVFKGKPNLFNFKTNYKCKNNKCKVCDKLITSKYFLIKNCFTLPIIDNCSCDAENIIYLIACKKCHMFYIGESGRTVKTRFYEHLNNISNYKKFSVKKTEISMHFGQSDHDLDRDIGFAVLKKDVQDSFQRKSLEADIINIFKALNIRILNELQPNPDNVKHLFFSSI